MMYYFQGEVGPVGLPGPIGLTGVGIQGEKVINKRHCRHNFAATHQM